MNLQEFAALKVGDQIENAYTSSRGTVSEVNDAGVRVRWGLAAAGTIDFHYPVNSTYWMHWSKP